MRDDTVLGLALLSYRSYSSGGSGCVLARHRGRTTGYVLNDGTVASVLIARDATGTASVLSSLTTDHGVLIGLTRLTGLTTATIDVAALSVVPVEAVLTGRRVLVRILPEYDSGTGHVRIRILVSTGTAGILTTVILSGVN